MASPDVYKLERSQLLVDGGYDECKRRANWYTNLSTTTRKIETECPTRCDQCVPFLVISCAPVAASSPGNCSDREKTERFSLTTPVSTSDGWVVHNILEEPKHGSLCLKNVGKSTWGNDPCKRLGARRLHFTTTHKKKKVYQPGLMTQLGGEGDKKGDVFVFD